MLRCWLRLHTVLGDLFQSHRISMSPGLCPLCTASRKTTGPMRISVCWTNDCEDYPLYIVLMSPSASQTIFMYGNCTMFIPIWSPGACLHALY